MSLLDISFELAAKLPVNFSMVSLMVMHKLVLMPVITLDCLSADERIVFQNRADLLQGFHRFNLFDSRLTNLQASTFGHRTDTPQHFAFSGMNLSHQCS